MINRLNARRYTINDIDDTKSVWKGVVYDVAPNSDLGVVQGVDMITYMLGRSASFLLSSSDHFFGLPEWATLKALQCRQNRYKVPMFA